MSIRPASPSDIPRIQALMKSVPGFWNPSWPPDVLERALSAPDTVSLVCEQEGSITGFACAHDVKFRAYLSELVVAPDAQGQGVGSRLLAEVERRLSARGCTPIIADVWRDAEPFYRSRGWSPPSVVLLLKHLEAAST